MPYGSGWMLLCSMYEYSSRTRNVRIVAYRNGTRRPQIRAQLLRHKFVSKVSHNDTESKYSYEFFTASAASEQEGGGLQYSYSNCRRNGGKRRQSNDPYRTGSSHGA
eukprot:scaffold133099_cov39-Prasinocladus_malaysianus.AAC.2